MAEFTPNLDDGELWLPSDIIKDVGVRNPNVVTQQHDAKSPLKLECFEPSLPVLLDHFEPAAKTGFYSGFRPIGPVVFNPVDGFGVVPVGPAFIGRFGPAVPTGAVGSRSEIVGTGVFLPRVKYDVDVGVKKVIKCGVEHEEKVNRRRTEHRTRNSSLVHKQGNAMMPLQHQTKQIPASLPADWTY